MADGYTKATDHIMKHFVIFCLVFSFLDAAGQSDAPLFYIENTPVHISEFKYIYEKNNRDNADYSKESLEEYLDLYINFKLKVQKARELGYHDSESYKEELAGYRSQLADSYVIDREVLEKQADQIYERSQWDVELQHILISLERKSNPTNVARARDKAWEAFTAIKDGLSFEDAVKEFSEDKNSVSEGGRIGFINAPLPDGYVALEHEAYRLNVGEISEPVRSDLGFHILKIGSKRPARGQMEAQHILIRNSRNGIRLADAKPRASRIYNQINSGDISFEEAVRKYSEDRETKTKGGNLGVFGIGQYEQSFEEGAFALSKDGEISPPVATSIGWHIVKRVRKITPQSNELILERIKALPKQGERFELARNQVVDKLKVEGNYSEDRSLLEKFTEGLDDIFFSYSWQPSAQGEGVLFTFDTDSYRLADFAAYAKSNTRVRMRAKGTQNIEQTVEELFSMYVNEKAIAYAEKSLEDRYPEFSNLMREYREGILLFDITKEIIWDKAARDTAGVANYYNQHSDKYIWKDRAQVTSYTLRSINPELVADVINSARNYNPSQLANKFNHDNELVVYKEELLESDNKSLIGISLNQGTITAPDFKKNLKVTTFKKIENLIPAGPKTLQEARGYVISDYQDYLDQEWIAQLKKEYKIKIQKKALKGLTKKS